MIVPNETNSIVICGTDYVTIVTSFLVERSSWFCVDPLPDNEWEIYYKPEQNDAVIEFVEEQVTTWKVVRCPVIKSRYIIKHVRKRRT